MIYSIWDSVGKLFYDSEIGKPTALRLEGLSGVFKVQPIVNYNS